LADELPKRFSLVKWSELVISAESNEIKSDDEEDSSSMSPAGCPRNVDGWFVYTS